jgi:RNA 2',3'-cyclic 3'-phosphodiesterase
MRTFLALDIPQEIKRNLLREISDISNYKQDGIKWVSEENLHITAQFIGEVSTHDIPEIVTYLQESLSTCNEVVLSNPQLQLKPGKNPRLCWIHLESQTVEMEKVIRRFRKFLLKTGYKIENRKIMFHITLFRIKKRLPEILTNKILTTELKRLNFKVSTATLYESILRPQGPDYYEIARFKLQRS